MRQKKRASGFTSGFTIVELLIVVIVIGVLAAISIIAYNGVQQSARDKSILSDTDGVEAEVVRYGTQHDGLYGTEVAWYSGGSPNLNIDFNPSAGNVIDVVASDVLYCIRVYNPLSNQKTLADSYEKGSSGAACDLLPPSAEAVEDSP